MSQVIPEIVSQHAEEAAFLWLLRDGAVHAPHYLLPDLIRLEARTEAHLDGLRANGEPGWEFCVKNLEEGDAGDVFAVAVLAFESGKDERIQAAIKAGTATPVRARGLVSALGWLPYAQVSSQIKKLIDADAPALRRLGIAALAVHRQPSGQAVAEAFGSDDPALKARALRAAGELGLTDLHPTARKFFAAEDPALRFWANWAAALLTGDGEAVANLLGIVQTKGPFQERALHMVLRRLDVRTAWTLQEKLAQIPELLRLAVIGAGILGVPDRVPWLIQQMKTPPVARVASEAFSMITGLHISYDKLEGEQPEGFEAGPTENPEDENVAMDADYNLYWPDPTPVLKWWEAHRKEYPSGVRHLLGKPMTPEWLQDVLKKGFQRQRAAAALELAIRKPGQPLFEVRAPGHRQLQALEKPPTK